MVASRSTTRVCGARLGYGEVGAMNVPLQWEYDPVLSEQLGKDLSYKGHPGGLRTYG